MSRISADVISARTGTITIDSSLNYTGIAVTFANLSGTAVTYTRANLTNLTGTAVTYTNATVTNITGTASTFGSIDVTGTLNPKGVIETVAAATTYMSGSAMVLELDVRSATTYTYTIPTGANVGIVSFKNMPADTGIQKGTTVTCIFTQNSGGTGNITAATGIGTNCTVVGYANGASVAGITTRALVGSGSSITLSTIGNDRDIVSFFIHYNGGTNTTASSYQVYATKNGSFR